MSLSDLLSRGYFPKELPAPFVTDKFSSVMTQSVPQADFSKKIIKGVKVTSGKPAIYSLARGGLLRRKLSICNPVSFYLLSREMIGNWTVIEKNVSGSRLSATAPEFKNTGRAINAKYHQSARSQWAQKSRLGQRFTLTADISRFYHSVYTHSIAWALHTKQKAKANRTFALLGNKLDFLVQKGQDGQTAGIPIGPDTSLVLAELIMHRCDSALVAKLPEIRGHRFIDDFELSFATRSEAEDAYHILEGSLSDYELALNYKKTRISELPLPLESSWALELKHKKDQFRTSVSGQGADLERFFTRAFELYTLNGNEAVLQLAISLLRNEVIHTKNWELFQRLILLCVVPEPATLPYALEQIISRVNAGAVALTHEIQEILNKIIAKHAVLRHSSEVANALWACLALRLSLDNIAVDAVSKCEDTCIALLALHCRNEGLLSKSLDTTLWEQQMNQAGLYDEHWLLAYEANVKGWLPNAGGIDFVSADPNFSYLKVNGVYFYNESDAVSEGEGLIPMPKLPSNPPGYSDFELT